jgi:hypothetical protein
MLERATSSDGTSNVILNVACVQLPIISYCLYSFEIETGNIYFQFKNNLATTIKTLAS